jgi:hypothetical protein
MFFKTSLEKNVDFSKLRILPLEVYVEEGYGGKKDISLWPEYTFFQAYINGQHETGYSAYHNWYLSNLKKYHSTQPEKGGLYGTKIYHLVVRKYRENNIDFQGNIFFNPEIVSQVIKELVDSRFALLGSIKEKGYIPGNVEPVHGFQRNGTIYLLDGHHRWAILTLLGYNSFPEFKLCNVYDDKWWFRALFRILHRKPQIYKISASTE